ncbi:MAG: glycosyltransferase [Actinomycetota bacterium]|nr:glycosyltransferase [Actinomycetota bacterium]MDA3003561.1 glycosyltransferase [Actinomycetota bacterium]
MSNESIEESQSQTVSAPLVVTAMVVHQPGTWFDEVLAGLASQDYPNISNVFFLTTTFSDSGVDTSNANLLSTRITDTLPNSVVRIVEGNPGFGRMINELQRIVEGDGGLFCIMHDDVVLNPNTVRTLVQELFISNAAVVGPKLLQWEKTTILQSVGFGIDRCGEVDPFIEQNERDQEQHDSVRDVFFVSSACMLVRSDLFRELNGFNQDISFFGEDLDFCWRAHLSGARVLVSPTAVARHLNSFETRSPHLVSRASVARNRARTVAALTSRWRLPFAWLQMLLTSAIETILGVFTGTFRESLASVRSTVALLVDASYIWRRRQQVRPLRRVAASEIAKLQVRGSARFTRFIRRRRALASQEIASLVETKKRWKQSSTRTAGTTLLVVTVLILLGSREIITDSSRVVGEMLPFENGSVSTSSILTNFLSGWWSSGFGEASANPTGLGLIALASFLLFGNLALLQTLMIVGSLFIGLIGMWRLCGAFANTRVRLGAAVVYAALPLSYDAISRGRFSVLVCVAAAPWLFDILNRYQDDKDQSLVRRTQLVSGLLLILGLVFAFTPSIAILFLVIICLWVFASFLGGVSVRKLLTTSLVGLTGLLGSVFINLPWSMHFVSSNWWQLLAGDQGVADRKIGLGSLARLDLGNTRGGFLVLAIYFCVVCALIVADSWRRLWAIRAAVLVVFGLLFVVLDDQGELPFALPEPSVMLTLVACGLALAVATCLSVFAETNMSRTSDWRRSLSLLVPISIALTVAPTLLSVTDGRWNQPETLVPQLLEQLPDNPKEGNYRTLYIGDRDLLPVATNSVTDEVSYGVADDGAVNFSSYWAPQETAMNLAAKRALTSLVTNDTIRIGRLISPLAIRYLVVPLGDSASTTATNLVESLSNQLDLRRIYFARDLAIFENVSWLPIVSVLSEESSVASEQASDIALTSQELKSTTPMLVDENSVAAKRVSSRFSGGTVHVAVPFDSRWHLMVDDAQLSPRVAFGSSTAFDAPIAGVASLQYQTSPLRYLYLILQALVWLCLLMLAANFSRFRGRIRQIEAKRVTLVADSSRPEQKIDMASR